MMYSNATRSLTLFARIFKGNSQLSQRARSRFILGRKTNTPWTEVEHLQLLSKSNATTSASARHQVLTFCQQMESLGYAYDDVATEWFQITRHNPWVITWATHNLLMEQKKVSSVSLLHLLQSRQGNFCHILQESSHNKSATPTCYLPNLEWSEQVPRQQSVPVLADMLKNAGADSESVQDLHDTLINAEGVSDKLNRDCVFSVSIARLLMAYLNVSPDHIMAEFTCLQFIDLPLLIERWCEIRACGLVLPNEILAFLTGKYIKPARRSPRSHTSTDVLKLLQLSKAEADKLGFTTEVIATLLQKTSLATLEKTYIYLLDHGYSYVDIAKVPFILAFSSDKIDALLSDKSSTFRLEAANIKEKSDKLNFLVKCLQNIYSSSRLGM